MFQRIIVPLDGSPIAEQALIEAIKLARLCNAPIHLLRIVGFMRLELIGPYSLAVEAAAVERTVDEEERVAAIYLEDVAKRLSNDGLAVRTEVRQGLVNREIIAATKPGDIVVMASHGRGGVSRWLLGSVAEDTLRHSSVPVLLIKADP